SPGWNPIFTWPILAVSSGTQCLPWHLAINQLAFPLVHERPIDSARAKIGHVKIGFQPGDRAVDQAIVLAEHRPVAGQQPLDITGPNALQRLDKVGNAAAMV